MDWDGCSTSGFRAYRSGGTNKVIRIREGVLGCAGTGLSPLHDAVVGGSDLAVERLLSLGADANGPLWGQGTPLHFAAKMGRDKVVKLLVARGADINAVDDRHWTPLHYACEAGHR